MSTSARARRNHLPFIVQLIIVIKRRCVLSWPIYKSTAEQTRRNWMKDKHFFWGGHIRSAIATRQTSIQFDSLFMEKVKIFGSVTIDVAKSNSNSRIHFLNVDTTTDYNGPSTITTRLVTCEMKSLVSVPAQCKQARIACRRYTHFFFVQIKFFFMNECLSLWIFAVHAHVKRFDGCARTAHASHRQQFRLSHTLLLAKRRDRWIDL